MVWVVFVRRRRRGNVMGKCGMRRRRRARIRVIHMEKKREVDGKIWM